MGTQARAPADNVNKLCYSFSHMVTDIPGEQLARLRPVVEALLSAFHQIEKAIPMETDSALVYDPQPEEQA